MIDNLSDVPPLIVKYLEESSFKLSSLKDVGIQNGFFHLSGIFYLKSGRFTISIPQKNMETMYSFVFEPKHWFGSMSIMKFPSPFVMIHEVEKAKVMHIPENKLMEIAGKDPSIYKWLLKIATDNFPFWLQVPVITACSKDVRVIYYLTTLLPQRTTNDNHAELTISQQEISEICGLSRPRVNEVLKELEQQGILQLSYKKIKITDVKRFFERLDNVDLAFYDPRAQKITTM